VLVVAPQAQHSSVWPPLAGGQQQPAEGTVSAHAQPCCSYAKHIGMVVGDGLADLLGLGSAADAPAAEQQSSCATAPEPAYATQEPSSKAHEAPHGIQKVHQHGSSGAADVLALAGRVACLHARLEAGASAQGDATASMRLLLATVSAKQQRARAMLSELQMHRSNGSDAHETSVLQAELERARAAVSTSAALVARREAELRDAREGAAAAQAETAELQQRLLDAEVKLAHLSASLPGGRWQGSGDINYPSGGNESSGHQGGTEVAQTSDGDAKDASHTWAIASAAAAAGGAGAGSGPVTPPARGGSSTAAAGAGLMTPDQAAAAQLRGWLAQSQAALMEAQEELNAREAELRELRRTLAAAVGGSSKNDSSSVVVDGMVSPCPSAAPSEPAQRVAEQQDAEAREGEGAVREAVYLRSEMGESRERLREARAEAQAARDAAVAAQAVADEVQRLAAQQQLQQQADLQAVQDKLQKTQAELEAVQRGQHMQDESSSLHEVPDAAGLRLLAAEEELRAARADAAAAALEVEVLRKQQQQQQPLLHEKADMGVSDSSSGRSEELLRTVTEKEALEVELADTRSRLLLLLQLVRRAAGRDAAHRLPAELASLMVTDGGACEECPSDTLQVAEATLGWSDTAPDAACLSALVLGLEERHSRPAQLQLLQRRGRELQAVLEHALVTVHSLKAAAGGGGCAWPTSEAAGGHTIYPRSSTCTDGAQAATAPPTLQAPPSPLPPPPPPQQQQQPTGLAPAAPAPQHLYWGAAADTAGSTAPVSSIVQYEVRDEGLSYDGLDGAWWNTSAVDPVTEIPDFLLLKRDDGDNT
jgi:hypothetical protein